MLIRALAVAWALWAVLVSASAADAGQILLPPPPQEEKPGSGERAALRFVWRDHPSLRAGSMFRVDFQLKLEEDGRRAGDDPPGLETFELHRARIGVEGELFQRIQYSVERELSERETGDLRLGGRSQAWKNVYVDVNILDALQVRAGRFKIPFGLEMLTSISNLDFIYRSLSGRYLAPSRDEGVALHGQLFDDGLNYWAGFFRHDGDHARTRRILGGDDTYAARVTFTPFGAIEAANLDNLEVSAAFARTDVSDESLVPNGLRARTVLSQHLFYEPVFVKGHRRRFETDVDWEAGPFSARAEYTWVGDDRLGQGLRDEDLPEATARAWYVSGSWVVTGEEKERPLEVRREFLTRGLGALEVAARYERLRFASRTGFDEPFRNSRAETILPVSDKVLTLGVNWYVNRWIKLRANAIREHIDDAERNPVLTDTAFWSQVLRLQLGL